MTSASATDSTEADSTEATSHTERFSPLHAVHLALGASFTDFGGWQMPVRYSSDLAEHHAVRTAAGIFDISHMAEIQVSGPDAGAFLDYALAGKLSAVKLMQAKYSLLLSEQGGVIDDVVAYRTAEDEYLVVANAGNHAASLEALSARAGGFDVTVTDQSDATALIAVQGPNARAILEATAGLAIQAGGTPLDEVKYYWSTIASFAGSTVFVARTGYTGEDGFELYVNTADAEALWGALTAAGADHGLVPCGLASRDTLRLEAGMPLYGHELGTEIFPAQSGLGRVVALAKEGDFVGRAASEKGPDAGARVLVGLVSDGKRAGRADYELYATTDGGEPVGVISSGALSPTLGHPVAMAFVSPELSELGTELFVDIRGKRVSASVVAMPFYKRAAN